MGCSLLKPPSGAPGRGEAAPPHLIPAPRAAAGLWGVSPFPLPRHHSWTPDPSPGRFRSWDAPPSLSPERDPGFPCPGGRPFAQAARPQSLQAELLGLCPMAMTNLGSRESPRSMWAQTSAGRAEVPGPGQLPSCPAPSEGGSGHGAACCGVGRLRDVSDPRGPQFPQMMMPS